MNNPVENFLNANEEAQIIAAIQKAELETSGEIRVHLEQKSSLAALDRAKALFHFLKMDNTKDENGVLFYVNISKKQLAIWGGNGINTMVEPDFWETIKDQMITHFKNNNFALGLEEGIRAAGKKLVLYFPWQHNDTNELPDQISWS